MTSLVEVELPRYTIAALDRNDAQYWKVASDHKERFEVLGRQESTLSMIEHGQVSGFLRGGSWRTFNWRRLVTGRKLYRIQYEDELREPPAEMDFADLIHFLLDWGAVPDPVGWHKLKTAGLWTPGATVLMKRQDYEADQKRGIDWVLRTSIADESDGVLSLALRWSWSDDSPENDRGSESLPPGWGRLEQPEKGVLSGKVDAKGLAARIQEIRAVEGNDEDSSCRFHSTGPEIDTVKWEQKLIETGEISSLWIGQPLSTSMWWSSAVSALIVQKHSGGGLWSYVVPDHILSFAKRSSMPCGILVLLDILGEDEAPSWTTETDSRYNTGHSAMKFHNRMMEKQRAIKMEEAMPQEQAHVARMNRQMAETQQLIEDTRQDRHEREEKRDMRIRDAINSPRLTNKAVGEACLAYLIRKEKIGQEWSLQRLTEAVLYLMLVDSSPDQETRKIVEVLEEWLSWSNAGGMKTAQLQFLEDRRLELCYAASLVHIIEEAAGHLSQSGTDMTECLRLWPKIRLG